MKKAINRREIVILAVYALGLGLALSLTGGLHFRDIWSGPAQNYVELGFGSILKGIGLAVPVFLAVFFLNRLLPAVSARMIPDQGRLSGRAFFFVCWGILLISWLPYLLSFYPGGVVGDGAETLEYAIRTDTINSKWGVTQIMAFRLFLALGRAFSPDVNFGIFLYALCTCLLYAAACAAVIVTLRKKGVPNLLLILFLFIYAFFGHYAAYSISLWKDSLFGAGVVTFSLLLWTQPAEGEPRRAWTVKAGALLLFLCFWRNFASYGLLVSGILILICSRFKKRLTALLLILVPLFSILIQGPVYHALGIRGQTSTEALAVPLQQVAAAIHEGAELKEEEAETVDRILPLGKWEELYAPAISDSLKYQLNDGRLQAHTADFLKVWLRLMLRYPGAYARAYLMETAGFWQPYGSNKGAYYDWFVGVQDLYGRGYREQDLILENTGYSLKNSLKGRLPFIPSGTLVWLLLLSLALVLCRGKGQRKGLAALLPCFLIWAAVMLTAPIAYSYRYVELLAVALPLLVCVPLLRKDEVELAVSEPAEDGRRRIVTRIMAVLLAGAAVAVTLTGLAGRIGLSGGQLEIQTFGAQDNADMYITAGLSAPEEGFRWTDGDEFTVSVPCGETGWKLEVIIRVRDTFNGTQRYAISDAAGREIFAGAVTGAGEIRFEAETETPETVFTVELPDARRVSDVTEGSKDRRKIAMQISGIDVRQAEEEAGRSALPLFGKTVLLAGDSRSSDDYTFYRETMERKAGCRAVTAGASGKTAAFNASDEYLSAVLNTQHDYSVWLVGGNDDGSPGTVGTFDAVSALAAQGEPVMDETDVTGNYDGTTFIQAVDHIMRKYLRETESFRSENGKKPVMVFCTDLPQQRDTADSPWSRQENWERKRLAILECCEKNGVVCLDLYSLCAFDMTQEPMFTPPTDTEYDRGNYYMDGLHPNPRGIDVITDYEIQKLEEISGQ